ncbi:iron chelate uptake ABC transporter family permease subunit [Microbacterium fluvii]
MTAVATSARLRSRRLWGVAGFAAALVVLAAASLAIGSNPIPIGEVWRVLTHPDGSMAAAVVTGQRVPRTLVVIVVGVALGVAGALMQSLTRNPLADPGVLGINAGASLAVVGAVAFLGVSGIWSYLWFAFAGAAAGALAAYVLGSSGRSGPTPVRLALAGVAISMAVSSLVQAVILSNQEAFNEFRFWASGSAEGRGYAELAAVTGFIVVGTVIALCLAPALNALALGDEAGRALGVRVGAVRTAVVASVALLAGAATAALGPIMFVGLAVPYLARAVCGSDQRWVLPVTAIAAPTALLAADIVGRVVAYPAEVPVGIIAAVLGGPVFVALVRRRRIEAL